MAADHLLEISRRLCDDIGKLTFSPPVECVYNPLQYAWANHEAYLRRFGDGPKKVLFLGMNPGPWGMAQTGIPFGDIPTVRDWMRLTEAIERPVHEHPKRPIRGLECARVEVSGSRLWGWVRQRFTSPEAFFRDHLVVNYCPLMFMEASGRNRTPDKLPASEAEPLLAACNRALQDLVDAVGATLIVGVGVYARRRASEVLKGRPVRCEQILHPSPASPAANRGWAEAAEAQMREIGIEIP